MTCKKDAIERAKGMLAELIWRFRPAVHELREQHWLDNYNGFLPKIVKVEGVPILDDELYELVEKALNLLDEDPDPYGRGWEVIKIVATKEGRLLVNAKIDMYNQYNSWVGTQYSIFDLLDIIRELKEKRIDIKEIKDKLMEQLSKL